MNPLLADTAGEKATPKADDRRLALLWTAVATAVALHNGEEWFLDMTGWVAGHSWLPGRSLHGDQAEFTVVLALVAAAVLGIAATAAIARPRWSAPALVCVAYALMINGASHVLLSLLSWNVMPGTISGSIVLVPLGAFVVRVLPPAQWTVSTIAMTVVCAVGITAGAFALASAFAGID